MIEDVFGIETFNLISDDEYYYVFRALNRDDQREIAEGITYVDGKLQKVLTNKQRFPENDKYAENTEISLAEVWDHTKSVNYYKGTSCISLSSNANVSLDYGSKYGHKYIMIRIPKDKETPIHNAGQYMISELNKIIEQILQSLPQDSEISTLISEIDSKTSTKDIRAFIADRFESYRSSGKYTSKGTLTTRDPIRGRFNDKQAFTDEQQTEYSKLMAKLTLLEMTGNLPKELLSNINLISLIRTIGSEFSNREFLHYGELSSEVFVPICKFNMDILALLQIAKEQGVSEKAIKQIEKRIIEFTNQGYEIIAKDGNLYYSNGNNEIPLNISENSIVINDGSLVEDSQISIEEAFEKTNGTISYSRVKNAATFVHNISVAQRKTLELASVMKIILGEESLNPVIDEIAEKSISINDGIITRKNGMGIQVSESVNIDINRGNNKEYSKEEQTQIYEGVKGLSIPELESIIAHNGDDIEQRIYVRSLAPVQVDPTKTREERLNRYYAEAIIDTLNIKSIYRNAIRDKSFSEEERDYLLGLLEKADCKRLVEAFKKAGVSESEVAGYIINILACNGYQGHSFEELSRLDNLDEVISKNVDNGNLKGHVYASVLEELRGIRDNDNLIEGTLLTLKDYQKEAADSVDKLFDEGKRFAGVVLPTGAGKSFVAMYEMLKNRNGNIVYVAPQREILNQIQMHILKNIAKVEVLTTQEIEELKKEQGVNHQSELKLPKGKILPTQVNEYLKKEFPHLKMFCYQGLSEKSDAELSDEQKEERDVEEKELREVLKNADANLMVFDELHRIGAKSWNKCVEQLIKRNDKANILGITATPIRDIDKIDTMLEIAKMVGTYTADELAIEKYVAYYMNLTEAIQSDLVVEPKIVSFDFMLKDLEEYQTIVDMIANEEDEAKRNKLIAIKAQMDEITGGDTDIGEHVKSSVSDQEITQIGKIIEGTIQKKDGRYLVLLPQHKSIDGLTLNEYFEQQKEKIREMLSGIDAEPEFYRLSSGDSKVENAKAINNFENSKTPHIKIMMAINKLNEGVHIDGINGEIMLRKIGEGHVILYLQQLGRVIFALDKNKPLADEDIPIVYDIYNNYLIQPLDRMMKKTNPKSDLEKLKEIVDWVDKHGYYPDINSEDLKEAKTAIRLKKIQTKYKKYLDGINNPRLNKSDIHKIEQIVALANSINLFSQDIGTRIIPPGEKDIGEVQLFKVTASQKRFLELYKEANKVVGNTLRHKRKTARLQDILNILDTINSYDVFIDNNLIKYGDTLKEVIEKCPEEYREALKEDLSDFDEEYPIGQEFNFAKTAYRQSAYRKIFEEMDVKDLYSYGIFENIDYEYLKSQFSIIQINTNHYNESILSNGFIKRGPKSHKGLNVKTGTYYDEDGKLSPLVGTLEEKYFKKIKILKIALEYLPEGYSFANTSVNELPSITLRTILNQYSKDHNMDSVVELKVPGTRITEYLDIDLTNYIKEISDYIENHQLIMDSKKLIEYKKLGIIPLEFDENGMDIDTGKTKEFLGKSIKEHEVLKKGLTISQSEFDGTVSELSNLQKIYGITLANKSIDDIPEGTFEEFASSRPDKVEDNSFRPRSSKLNIREQIKRARAYLEDKLLSNEAIIKYKRLRYIADKCR